MAGIRATIATPSEITVNSTTTTLLQLVAPSNQRLVVKKISVSWSGSNEVEINLETQTTAGTMTSLTPVTTSGASETLQATAQHTATAEPTSGNTIMYWSDDNPVYEAWGDNSMSGIHVAGGTRIGVVATTTASTNISAWIEYEE